MIPLSAKISYCEDKCLITWENETNSELDPDDFCKVRLPFPKTHNPVCRKNAVISGQAPLWCYMLSALALFEKGASSIAAYQPQSDEVQFFPFGELDAATDTNVYPSEIDLDKDSCFIEYAVGKKEKFFPEQIPAYIRSIPEPRGKKLIIISGKLCNWLAAVLAIAAKMKGWKSIGYFSPRNPHVLQISPELKQLEDRLRPLRECGKTIIGIVGDPNSGKSVFSHLLHDAGNEAGERIWFKDCDYSSPTSQWFLETLKRDPSQATEMRKSNKREWTPGAENKLSENLKTTSTSLDWLIADLPGGKFSAGSPPQRIPPGCEKLMEAIDFFIVLAKKTESGDSGDEWQYALKQHGLDKRILFRIYSESPKEKPKLWREADGSLHICGLDRLHADTFTAEIRRELWTRVKAEISKIKHD